MKRKIIYNIMAGLIILSFIMALISCEKDNDEVTVQYVVKGLTKKFRVAYLNENGNTVYLDSVVNKNWTYTFKGEQGDLVYLFLRHQEDVSYMTKFQFRIIVNGKIYKDAYTYDIDRGIVNKDSLRYEILRSGVVPF
jgi:hypothetical protein